MYFESEAYMESMNEHESVGSCSSHYSDFKVKVLNRDSNKVVETFTVYALDKKDAQGVFRKKYSTQRAKYLSGNFALLISREP